eukprot:9492524-Pyramimonas_sp.AAC.1
MARNTARTKKQETKNCASTGAHAARRPSRPGRPCRPRTAPQRKIHALADGVGKVDGQRLSLRSLGQRRRP